MLELFIWFKFVIADEETSEVFDVKCTRVQKDVFVLISVLPDEVVTLVMYCMKPVAGVVLLLVIMIV